MAKFIIGSVILVVVLFYPFKSEVTINKSHINSIRPFAGTINGELVGTHLCVSYWLDRENQPEVATYTVWSSIGFGIFGYIYKIDRK